MRTNRSLAAAAVLAALVGLTAGLAQAGDEVRAPLDSTRVAASEAQQAGGRELYLRACAACHGADGQGTGAGPGLVGVGAAAADFQLSTGRMPLAGSPRSQATRKPPAFSAAEIEQLVAYVASLGAGPEIPVVSIREDLLSRGQRLFVGNCAPCHGATGRGGAVGGGALAPPLDEATPVQVAEAMLTGPGQMPVFRFAPDDQDAVATYVAYLRRAPNPGGFSIGGIGPVPEGFVAWVLGMGLLVGMVYLVGREWDRAAGRQQR
ncbi:MAG: cytochrome bc1 complex diheme cytochrome c subunit [Candidatus Limnocylindria bacterium]